MAITVLRKTSPRPVPGGLEGTFEQRFTCAFSTTDLTGTIPSGMKKVIAMGAPAFLQAAASDEVIHYDGTVNAEGSFVLATGDLITLTRVCMGPTSGLKFCITFEGYV